MKRRHWCSLRTLRLWLRCYRHARRHASCSVVTRKRTCAPPVGAAPLNVTVPWRIPTATLVGFSESEERVGGGGGAGHRERGSSGSATVNAEMVTVSTRPPWSCSLECRGGGSCWNGYARRCAGCPVVARKRYLRTTCGAARLTLLCGGGISTATLVGFSESEERVGGEEVQASP